MGLYEKALKTVEDFGMIKAGEKITVGVSGGADSTVLLDFLCRLRETKKIGIEVCHINHCLRGEESDRDEEFVRKMCERLGVGCRLLKVDIKKAAEEAGISSEECGRNVRYGFFEEVACGGKIATAHTLSDSMETAVFNIARGAGLKGICGIPPVRGNIIRPLIECTRREVEEYASERGLEFVTDSTNLTDDYTRNKIRHNVIPGLYAINGSYDRAFLRMSKGMRKVWEYLGSQADELIGRAKSGDGYDAKTFSASPEVIRSEAIIKLFNEKGIPVSEKRVDSVLSSLSKGKYVEQLDGKTYFCLDNGVFRITERPDAEGNEEFSIPLKEGEYGVNSEYELKCTIISGEKYKNLKKINQDILKNSFDYGKLIGKAVVRNRIEGDKISLAGRNCSKTLKKLFNENGIPVEERGSIPCVADDRGIVWVAGVGCDKRAAIDENSEKICVCITEKREDKKCTRTY